MHLYDPEFLFAFLPLFIGLYAVIPSKKRPILIMLGNLLFMYTAGKYALIGFLIVFFCAYFSGISIYNMRNDPEKELFRRKLLGGNIAFFTAVFAFFSVSGAGGMEKLLFAPSSVYFMAVVPLHLVSYLFDVYRGDCEAQTRLSSLAAYAGFFPSASFGPILKYKSFENSFKAPKMSVKKMASGIRLYIFGLVEYLIIARRLEAIRTEMISAPDSLRGGTGWLFVPLFYVMFTLSILGMIHMGRGVALMLGFYVRPPSRRTFFTDTLLKRFRQMNEPLAGWLNDYIYKPLRQSTGKESTALLGAICAGALWYSFSLWWALAGATVTGLIALQMSIYKNHVTLSVKLKGLITRLLTFVAAVFCVLMELPSDGIMLFNSSANTDNAFLWHLVSETAIPITIGALFIGSLLPELIRRINYVRVRALIPVVELFLLVVCISFMLNIV